MTSDGRECMSETKPSVIGRILNIRGTNNAFVAHSFCWQKPGEIVATLSAGTDAEVFAQVPRTSCWRELEPGEIITPWHCGQV
jgi:hypothetical protein